MVAIASVGSKTFLIPPPPTPVGEAGLLGMNQEASHGTASTGMPWLVGDGHMARAWPPRACLRISAGLRW